MPQQRRFPPPWSVEETDACFIVRDANGEALAYVYFEEEPGRRPAASFISLLAEVARSGQDRSGNVAFEQVSLPHFRGTPTVRSSTQKRTPAVKPGHPT